MLTYQKTIESPILEIRHDDYSPSPRGWDNLGKFVTAEKRYMSPDEDEEIQAIIANAAEGATSAMDHFQKIEKVLAKMGYQWIFPITRYEHSGVVYKIGVWGGWDDSFCGVYAVPRNEDTEKMTREDAERIVRGELDAYNAYANGEVYYFVLFDENGNEVDSCGGFYDIDDIREYLGEEWDNEDLDEYIK